MGKGDMGYDLPLYELVIICRFLFPNKLEPSVFFCNESDYTSVPSGCCTSPFVASR